MHFAGGHFSLTEEEDNAIKENILLLLASFYSESASFFPRERNDLQEITDLITSSTIHNVSIQISLCCNLSFAHYHFIGKAISWWLFYFSGKTIILCRRKKATFRIGGTYIQ